MTLNNQEISEIKELLSTPKRIRIIPHRNVDGDAMGSTLGLCFVLQQLSHDVKVVVPNEIPEYLQWMPGLENTIIFEDDKPNVMPILDEADVVFTLDFNAFHRAGEQLEPVLKRLKGVFIMIDHHEKPDNYAKYTFSSIEYSSTCQMVYDFLKALDLLHLINKDVATCLYTGITTDSGSFRYPRTTGDLHRIVAELIDKGIDNPQIHINLFDNSDYNRLQLLGCALQNLKILEDYKTSYISLSDEELKKYNFRKGDTEGIVNYGLTIKDVDFTAFFTEIKDEEIIKISFRSQGDFDVNIFARNHFNGGGHKNAAGGKSFDTLEATINKFISILATEKNNS